MPEKTKKDSCFTIMPFGDYFEDYYSDIYIPAIEAAGLISYRADNLYRPSAIVHDIWRFTRNAKLILADLTGKNPNVFYELGLAHAIAKPAILVTESMDDVPFDLRALRVIEYDKNKHNWGTTLKEKITRSIKEVLASPNESVPPPFLEIKYPVKTNVTLHEKEILEIKQDLNLIKKQLRTQNTIQRRDILPRENSPTAEELDNLMASYRQTIKKLRND